VCPSKKFQKKKGKKFARLVYAINDGECEPIVIPLRVCGQTINAMLDTGSMENVMDIQSLNKVIPNVRLKYFPKRLIGADKKPISVVGSTQIPLNINGISGEK